MARRSFEAGGRTRWTGRGRRWAAAAGCWGLALVVAGTCAVAAQAPASDRAAAEAMARRVSERVRALQREGERLAGQARTLVGDLRRLEVERNLAIERLKQATAGVAAAELELTALLGRLTALERTRVESLPDLRARFVELYKQGRGSYARMLAGVRDLRELGRATRAVASLAHINQQRIADHRRTLAALRRERDAIEQKTHGLLAARAEAQRMRGAADRAFRARTALLADIDARRDLNAQLAGELVVAQQKLQAAMTAMRSGEAVEPVSVPLTPFRGALDWPVLGPVTAAFGRSNRLTEGSVRNGIEISAPDGTPVHTVHPGTIGFADSFTGYGTLVIVDHGSDHYSLYGYLSSVTVERGQRVEAGQELGRVGLAPAGDAALYFEVRIDGRSVDPVQWLKRR
ncbi:MAG: murein hydrolase activator EnvC family protein [Vicinamibacterales bacterium]